MSSVSCGAPRSLPARESGFSLVEIVIAMFILALMSLALIPLMISTTGRSASNRSQVTATTYANAQLAALRQQVEANPAMTCTAIDTAAATLTWPAAPAENDMASTVDVLSCPAAAARPGTITVSVSIASVATPGAPLATLTTEVLVT